MARRAVWKYTIELGTPGVTEFQIPEGARFLHCAAQHGAMCMWFEVPVGESRTARRGFRIFGTGEEIDAHLSYVGTGQFKAGAYVFHVYEVSLQCPRCRGLSYIPDWTNWDEYHGEPKPKPCPDCKTEEASK